MNLYLVQHAFSNSKEIDPERGISEEGKAETAKTAGFLSGLHPDISVIWRSDKKRSLETAVILADKLGIPECVELHRDIDPMDSVLPVKKELEWAEKNTMIVGHLPYLSNLSTALLKGRDNDTILKFRNLGIVCLERNDGLLSILWAVTPQIL
jgi:phosphohistidine phosphatase